jgi:hypothetical protein
MLWFTLPAGKSSVFPPAAALIVYTVPPQTPPRGSNRIMLRLLYIIYRLLQEKSNPKRYFFHTRLPVFSHHDAAQSGFAGLRLQTFSLYAVLPEKRAGRRRETVRAVVIHCMIKNYLKTIF